MAAESGYGDDPNAPLQRRPYSPYGRSEGMPGIDPNAPLYGMRPKGGVAPGVMAPGSTGSDRPPVDSAGTLPQPQQPMLAYSPGGPSSSLPTYSATDNLRNRQIAPTQNFGAIQRSNTAPAMDAYGRSRSNIATANPTSAEAQGTRAMAFGDLQNLSGPNRAQLAQDIFGQIEESSRPQFEKDIQGVGRKAAAFGRLGSGVTTSELGDVVSNRERDLGLMKRNLASEAAGQTLDDKLGVFNARLAGSGQFSQEDLQRAGFGLQRGEAERGLGMTLEDSARRDRGEDVGERDFQYNQDIGNRQELRGERDFQNQQAQQAQQDYINQRTLEEMLLNGEWDRNLNYDNMLLGYGYGG